MRRRRNGKSGDCTFNLLEKLRRWNLTTIQELSRTGQRRTKRSIGDGKPSVLLGNGSETKEHQRQMKVTVRASQAGT